MEKTKETEMTPLEVAKIRRMAHGMARLGEQKDPEDPTSVVEAIVAGLTSAGQLSDAETLELEYQLARLGVFG